MVISSSWAVEAAQVLMGENGGFFVNDDAERGWKEIARQF